MCGARLHPDAARASPPTAWARQAPCSASKLPLGRKGARRAAVGAHLPITRLRSIAARYRRGGGRESSQAVAAERWAPFHAVLGCLMAAARRGSEIGAAGSLRWMLLGGPATARRQERRGRGCGGRLPGPPPVSHYCAAQYQCGAVLFNPLPHVWMRSRDELQRGKAQCARTFPRLLPGGGPPACAWPASLGHAYYYTLACYTASQN